MWLFREQGEISSFVNMDVLDVGFQRVQELFSSSELGCARCAIVECKEIFKICELGCARCGFSESAGTFQLF